MVETARVESIVGEGNFGLSVSLGEIHGGLPLWMVPHLNSSSNILHLTVWNS